MRELPARFVDEARESVAMLLTAMVWSVLSRSAEALAAFRPPAPREFLLLTS